MDVVELGVAIADTLTLNLAAPSIEVQDVVIRAPGGVFTGSVESMLDQVEASIESGQG